MLSFPKCFYQFTHLPPIYDNFNYSISSSIFGIEIFSILVILVDVSCNLIVILIYISLMKNYVGNFFMYILVIWNILFCEVSIQGFVHCNWAIYLFIIDLQEFFTYSEYKAFLRFMYNKYTYPSLWLTFSFSSVYFDEQNLF